MAELVDALASGASGSNVVEVRVLSWAPIPCSLMFGDMDKTPENLIDSLLRCSQLGVYVRRQPPLTGGLFGGPQHAGAFHAAH